MAAEATVSRLAVTLLAFGLLLPAAASARLDPAAATVQRLDNGLTIIVLEEHALPVVSVQMLYRVGAKHEVPGATGLAHFLEHMAFRSSENFPDTGLVSEIYAIGGEWHGYTWLDQTTYFATAPSDALELLLRIEADRMARLDIPAADVEAERGAVLAEMHGYENDPGAVLQDNVMYLSFLAHPYRNNTIGWESDVAAIRHQELVDFYSRHYQPGNAVLAVVGDVRPDLVLRLAERLFGGFGGAPATPPPRTVEPPQQGERRIRLNGVVQRKHFKIAWHAPSVHSPDFAAFLVLQDMLSGGSGVSFLQNDWGTPARPDSPLAATAADIDSWYPPAEQDYVFTVSGSIDAGGDEAALEEAVAGAIEGLIVAAGRGDQAARQALAAAKERVRRALLFDVQTTEDAAHQLAFFAGMDALDVLLQLPVAVAAVELEDVRRVAAGRLGPARRSIGWMVPAASGPGEMAERTPRATAVAGQVAAASAGSVPPAPAAGSSADARLEPPRLRRLDSGSVAIARRSPLSSTVRLQVVLPGAIEFEGIEPDDPAWGYSSVGRDLLPGELPAALAKLAAAIPQATTADVGDRLAGDDPLAALQWHFRELLGLTRPASPKDPPRPSLVVATGDLDPQAALAAIEAEFGAMPAAMNTGAADAALAPGSSVRMQLEYRLAQPFAQEALGYVVPAAAPRDADAAAWRMALYLLSHDYEGRLGTEAISRRGLVYYIESAYGSDGHNGWITLATGVDPAKLPAMRRLLWAELQRLVEEPPTQAELDEARRHLLGRRLSAAQSNRELADRLARDWLWYGESPDLEAYRARLEQVTLEDLHRILPAFTAGTVIAVRGPDPSGAH